MKKSHSWFGIASFLLSLFPLSVLLSIGIAFGGSTSASSTANNPPLAEILASVIMVGVALAGVCVFALFWLAAISLGIVNLFQSNHKRVFGVLGIVFSAIAIAITITIAIVAITDFLSAPPPTGGSVTPISLIT